MTSPRPVALALLLSILSACRASPVLPTGTPANPTDAAGIVGQTAVAFLNRFSISSIPPEACLVDFSTACRGRADELGDITYNRAHFEIVGARLGSPTVMLTSGGNNANISMPCSWDSRATKCDEPGCVVGGYGSVGGTCNLTAVREPDGWKLCTSTFSGRPITPQNRNFFGPLR